MNRTIEPLNNHVLILPIELPQKSEGGLFLPEQTRDKSGEAEVISVGPGRLDSIGRMIAPGVKPGDRVLYSWIHGRDVRMDGREYKLIDADELLGVVK